MKGVGRGEINGAELRDAIYSALEVIGNTAREVFMDDLEKSGIEFRSDKTYSFAEIEKMLHDTFGTEGTSLVIGRIRKFLQIEYSDTT